MGAFPLTSVECEPADAVLFGAPHGTPYSGIDNRVHERSPQAIRDGALDCASWVDHWNYDVGGPALGPGGFRFGDLGDLSTKPSDGPGNRRLIEATTRAVVSTGAIPLMIGGDDSVPIPFLAGLDAHGPLTVLQIDAHIDWREARRGEPSGYSSTMRRASEMPHVERIIQVGMSNFGSARAEEVGAAREWGAQIVTARDVHHHGLERTLDLIPEQARVAITLDCDALEAGVMPAVMAPSPGGLTYTQVTDLIAGTTERGSIVSFDVVEFVPDRDLTGAAAVTAFSIILFMLGVSANR
jgi:agmatinase